jgi:soluble lytic murein transglycosylase-like protein
MDPTSTTQVAQAIKLSAWDGAVSCPEPMRCATTALALAGTLLAPVWARAGAVYSYVDKDGVVRVFDESSDEFAQMRKRAPRVRGRIVSTPQVHRIEIGERIAPGQALVRWNRSGKDYDPHVQTAARKYELPPALIKAVMAAESAFNPRAVSPRGALGLMQLMPDTARQMSVADVFDPAQNIDGGARYLRQLWTQYDGDLYRTLSAYNAGPEAVRRSRGQIPRIAETQDYVKRVLALYQAYIGST